MTISPLSSIVCTFVWVTMLEIDVIFLNSHWHRSDWRIEEFRWSTFDVWALCNARIVFRFARSRATPAVNLPVHVVGIEAWLDYNRLQSPFGIRAQVEPFDVMQHKCCRTETSIVNTSSLWFLFYVVSSGLDTMEDERNGNRLNECCIPDACLPWAFWVRLHQVRWHKLLRYVCFMNHNYLSQSPLYMDGHSSVCSHLTVFIYCLWNEQSNNAGTTLGSIQHDINQSTVRVRFVKSYERVSWTNVLVRIDFVTRVFGWRHDN